MVRVRLWKMTKPFHKSPPVGQEISCVMYRVKREFLLDNSQLEKVLLGALEKEKFSVLDVSSYNFSPQGFSFIALLAESHLAVHTYPEYGSLYFNMYSCRGPKDSEPVFNYVIKELCPEKIFFLNKGKVPADAAVLRWIAQETNYR